MTPLHRTDWRRFTMTARKLFILGIAFAFTRAETAEAETQALPSAIIRQLPAGYRILAAVHVVPDKQPRSFYVVALGRRNEANLRAGDQAPVRPLLIFKAQGPRFVLVARNDDVVLAADEGGQCDPFLDGGATIAVRQKYFTVQNGVSCGQHWTAYVTFRFDDQTDAFVFDNERFESRSLNNDTSPDAEALVRDGPPRVTRGIRSHPVSFAHWRPEQ